MLKSVLLAVTVGLAFGVALGARAPKVEARQTGEAKKMSVLAVQLTIKDYASWRSSFDSARPLRDKAGLKNVRVYKDADNPKEVLVWSDTDDLAKAREGVTGPEIRKAMEDSGVIGPPRVHAIP